MKKVKIKGSYDAIVIRYERGAKTKKRFPCGCKILQDGVILFCLEHWKLDRLNWGVKEMLQFHEKEEKEDANKT